MAGVRFDWDPEKDAENQRKHGVSFGRAKYAFADPKRVIAKDVSHSQTEDGITALAKLMAAFSRCDLRIVLRLFE